MVSMYKGMRWMYLVTRGIDLHRCTSSVHRTMVAHGNLNSCCHPVGSLRRCLLIVGALRSGWEDAVVTFGQYTTLEAHIIFLRTSTILVVKLCPTAYVGSFDRCIDVSPAVKSDAVPRCSDGS